MDNKPDSPGRANNNAIHDVHFGFHSFVFFYLKSKPSRSEKGLKWIIQPDSPEERIMLI
jgi:hypothetical protein